ncbi:MAG: transposase [Longimicrobiales bacterium]|nr:transposase [Longimicrobiales bacterium]
MGRQRRPYLPGGVFHLVARTLRREHYFTPRLRTTTLRAAAELAGRSQIQLLAVAAMSNHLHVVVRQGKLPLSAFMQPLLRRLAHRIQHVHHLDGPIFWRPYAARHCRNPSHVRNAIVYTHLNPVRAGVCDKPNSYPWTSHRLYLASSPPDSALEHPRLAAVLDPDLALPLFAAGPDRSTAQLREDYRQFVRWRLAADRWSDPDDDPAEAASVSPPPTAWQDSVWAVDLGPLFQGRPRRSASEPDVYDRPLDTVLDLATLARRTLAAEAPGLPLDRIRGRRGGTRAARLRHLIIRRLHAAGYPSVAIAHFIGLSESAVSYVICKRT